VELGRGVLGLCLVMAPASRVFQINHRVQNSLRVGEKQGAQDCPSRGLPAVREDARPPRLGSLAFPRAPRGP